MLTLNFPTMSDGRMNYLIYITVSVTIQTETLVIMVEIQILGTTLGSTRYYYWCKMTIDKGRPFNIYNIIRQKLKLPSADLENIGRIQEENTNFCNQKQVARFRDKFAKYEEWVCMRNLSPL